MAPSKIPGTGPPTSAIVPTVIVEGVNPTAVAPPDDAVVVFEALEDLLELQEVATSTPASKSGPTRLKRTLSSPELSQCYPKTARSSPEPYKTDGHGAAPLSATETTL
jgi:hypothetical protein